MPPPKNKKKNIIRKNSTIKNKRIDYIKKINPTYIKVFFITTTFLISVILGYFLASLIISDTINNYEEENQYKDYYDYYNYVYQDVKEFTDVLYVHPDGSNVDGLTWETAYATLKTALSQASSDLNDITLIILAPAVYDIDTEGIYVINKNVNLWAMSPNLVTIENNHISATGILQFNRFGGIFNIHIACGLTNTNGIIYNGNNSVNSIVNNLVISSTKTSGECKELSLVDGSYLINLEDSKVLGNNNTIGVYLEDSYHNEFNKLVINNCSQGIDIIGETSDFNIFTDLDIKNCGTGIKIEEGNQQTFKDITFLSNLDNVNDTVGDSIYSNIRLDAPLSVLTPNNLVGIEVIGGVEADTYGSDIEICSSVSRDDPFVIIAVMYEYSVAENAGLRLSDNNGTTYFFESIIDLWAINAVERKEMDASLPQIFNCGTRISCSIKTLSGTDTAHIWLQIKEI